MATAKAPAQLEAGTLSDFSGGPNFRDSPSELGKTEDYGSYNCTYDERGGAASRLGYVKRNAAALGAAGDLIVNDFYSGLLGNTLTQSGKSLYLGDGAAAVHTFTTKDCVTFTETDSYVVAAHPADGLFYSSDGNVWTQITVANAPTGADGCNCVAAWQGRLFVGLKDGSVHWSNNGDILTWTATDFNEVWTKDQEPIVALHIGSGQDIQGRPGLLVFKQRSVYRINDPATGAYTVVDATYGAGGPKAVVGVGAKVIWIGTGGIRWWQENQAEPVDASDLLRPLWKSDQLSFANQSGWCAGRRLNRAYFSCSTINSAVNDLAFEFHPAEGWVAPRSDAMSCYSSSSGSSDLTYGGSPTVDGQVYQLDKGGTDDGSAIVGWFQTRWVVPNGGFQAYLWQVRVHGRGTGTMTIRADYEDGGGTGYAFDLSPSGSDYDNGVLYDSGVDYAIETLQETEAFYSLGAVRQFSLRFAFSSTTTASGRQLFDSTPAPEVGSFGLFGLEYLYVPLGLS